MSQQRASMTTIEVSTHSLAEMTFNALNGKVNLDSIQTIWHAIGSYIRQQLLAHKAIRLNGFGVFTLSQECDPVFAMSNEMKLQYNLKQKPTVSPDQSLQPSMLNLAAIANKCNLPRDMCDKVYSKYISCLGRMIYEGRRIHLIFNKVAEMTFAGYGGELNCLFMPEIIDSLLAPVDPRRNPDLLGSPQRYVRGSTQGKSQNAIRSSATRGNSASNLQVSSSRQARLAMGSGRGMAAAIAGRPASAGTPVRNKRPGSASYAATGVSNMNPIGFTTDPRTAAARASNAEQTVDKVRKKIIERGGSNGIKSVTKLLSIMDDNGDKRLSKEELKWGLKDYGLDLAPAELEQLFVYFDRDRNGFVDIDEFLIGMKGDLNQRRTAMVKQAFDLIDRDGSGIVTAEELAEVYDVSWSPEVKSGKKTPQQAMYDFMKQWDKDGDHEVTFDEFLDYYKGVSASIDDDDYFELMIRNAWRIAGGSGWAANTANKRVLVTNRDGSQRVETINNELGLKAGDREGMRRRLADQGVEAQNIESFGGIDTRGGRSVAGSQRPAAREGGARARAPPALNATRNGSRNGNGSARGGGGFVGAPVQAWGGDEALPPQDAPSTGYTLGRLGSQQRPQSASGFDAIGTLRNLLYTPPVSLEELGRTLQVSTVAANPSVTQGAFVRRLSTLDPSLQRQHLKALWDCIDPANRGTASLQALHTALAGKFGKDKSAHKSNSSVIERVKQKILERCGGSGAGIKGLQRTLAIMDDSGDKKLDKIEFKNGMRDYGIELNLRELDDCFIYFDRDKNGFIDIDEFLIGIRGELNDRRRGMVHMAFDVLDTDRSGAISLDEIAAAYNVASNPDVISGKKTERQALRDFIKVWDKDMDDMVTLEEFEDYYKGVSSSIDGDDYFELMIRNAWHIPGGQGWAANTANKRVLVTDADGSQRVQSIDSDLGLKAGDKEGMMQRLKKQGVNASSIDLYGGMESKNKANPRAKPPRMDFQDVRAQAMRNARGDGTNPILGGPVGGLLGSGSSGLPASQYERNMAASKLAAAYRGRKARREALQEQRKVQANRREQISAYEDAQRPRPRQITRPKGKSYIGF